MSLILPDARLEQPALFYPGRTPVGRVKIDWSNPLTEGLDIACFILNGTPAVFNEANKGGNGVVSAGAVYDRSGGELGIDCNALSSYAIEHAGYKGVQGNAPRTFMGKFKYNAVPLSLSNAVLSGCGLNNDKKKWTTRINDAGVSGVRVEINGAYVVSNTAAPVNTKFTAAHAFPGGALEDVRLYLNGKLDGYKNNWGASINQLNIPNTAESDFRVGGSSVSDRHLEGVIYWYLNYSRCLSDKEIALIHLNPYQFLIPA